MINLNVRLVFLILLKNLPKYFEAHNRLQLNVGSESDISLTKLSQSKSWAVLLDAGYKYSSMSS